MKHSLTETEDRPPPKRHELMAHAAERANISDSTINPPQNSGNNAANDNGHLESLLPPLLRIPKDIRLHVYEYLLPQPGVVPSDRGETGVDRLLLHRVKPCPEGPFYSQTFRQAQPHFQLQRTYALRTWPGILRVNRQIYGEASDFMHGRLVFQADIYPTFGFERNEWHLSGSSTLQICSNKLQLPSSLTSQLRFMKRISLRMWLTRKAGASFGQGRDEPCVRGTAKAIKDHVNNFVLALKEAPCLKIVDVELQIVRSSRPMSMISRTLQPPTISDEEVANTVSWYARPFKHLRNVELNFRYIGDDSSSKIQENLTNIKQEVCSDLPVNEREPLCAPYTKFISTRAFRTLRTNSTRKPECYLPILLERLWAAQDTGDLESFRQIQKQIHQIWKEVQQMMEKSFTNSLEVGETW